MTWPEAVARVVMFAFAAYAWASVWAWYGRRR